MLIFKLFFMKKSFYFAMLTFAALFSFSSCSDDDNNGGGGDVADPGCYIINNGNWNGNDASLQYYNLTTGMASSPLCNEDIFVQQNGQILGDTGQDLLWIDGKLFVSVSVSQKLEVLDESGKRVRPFYSFLTNMAYPRMMATDGDKVYLTNYDGHVYVYDVATADSVTTYSVGSYPEGVSYCDGYLVVNNSDYGACDGDASISIINLADGTVREVKDNVYNPGVQSVVCNGTVYVVDGGNYYDIDPSILAVSPREGSVTSLGIPATLLAAYEGSLYYVNASWNYGTSAYDYSPLYCMDVVTGEIKEFLSANTMKNVNSLSVNPETGDIFIGYNGELGSLGCMRIFDADGVQRGLFDVGYFTSGARFETK